jgi:hypothetical protein
LLLIVGELAGIDREGRPRRRPRQPATGGAADRRLVALLEPPLEAVAPGGAGGGALVGLGRVAADDGAAALELGLLDREQGRAAVGARRAQGRERPLVLERDPAHQPVGALARAQDMVEPARLQRGAGRGRDHAAAGGHAAAADGEARPEPVDHADAPAHVGGAARPPLGADRPAVAVDGHARPHPHEVGAAVARVAAAAEALAAGAGERRRRRVEEHGAEPAERVAPAPDRARLDQALDGARGERRGAGRRGLAQLLAEPGRRPVDVAQGQALAAGERAVAHPPLAGAARAGGHQALQGRAEPGALGRGPRGRGRREAPRARPGCRSPATAGRAAGAGRCAGK